MSTPMQVIYPTVPPTCVSPATLISTIQQLRVNFPNDFAIWNIGPDEPTVENRAFPWHKTDPTTDVGVGDYDWSPILGKWVKNHWLPSGTVPVDERRIFVGISSDVDTYDGGDAGTVSNVSGPFWEIDTDFQDKFMIGVGATYTPVGTDFQIFDDAVPGDPKGRSIYVLKPTGRIYDVA